MNIELTRKKLAKLTSDEFGQLEKAVSCERSRRNEASQKQTSEYRGNKTMFGDGLWKHHLSTMADAAYEASERDY